MKRLIEKIKLIFVSQPLLHQPVVNRSFTIKYFEDGNLRDLQTWECIAESKEMAEYYFWDRHNSIYTDILSVEENGTLNKLQQHKIYRELINPEKFAKEHFRKQRDNCLIELQHLNDAGCQTHCNS